MELNPELLKVGDKIYINCHALDLCSRSHTHSTIYVVVEVFDTMTSRGFQIELKTVSGSGYWRWEPKTDGGTCQYVTKG